MATAAALTEKSRQGINSEIPPCIGLGARLSHDPRPGYGHAYDETPVDLVVYVRNDPINLLDPDGQMAISFTINIYSITNYYYNGVFDHSTITLEGTIDVTIMFNPPPPPVGDDLFTMDEPGGGVARAASLFKFTGGFEGHSELQYLIDQINNAANAIALAISHEPLGLPGQFRDCIMQIFKEGTKPGFFTNKQVTFNYTGSNEYIAQANSYGNFLFGSHTIDIGLPSQDPKHLGLYSNPYNADSTVDYSRIVGPEWIILHEAAHLCGENNEARASAIASYYFSPTLQQRSIHLPERRQIVAFERGGIY